MCETVVRRLRWAVLEEAKARVKGAGPLVVADGVAALVGATEPGGTPVPGRRAPLA